MNATHSIKHHSRGAALIYVVLALPVFMGLASLAVDLGRYQVAKTQSYCAALAAARAGAQQIANGYTAANAAVMNVATLNPIDGVKVTSAEVTVQWVSYQTGSYQTVTSSNFSSCNGVIVTINHTVPLCFGQVVGISSKPAIESSIVTVNKTSTNVYVYATNCPWNATVGSTNGNQYSASSSGGDDGHGDDGHGDDGNEGKFNESSSSGSSPSSTLCSNKSTTPVCITCVPNATIQITNVSGTVSCNGHSNLDATGNALSNGTCSTSNCSRSSGIGDCYAPVGALTAVFQSSSTCSTPATAQYGTQPARDYTNCQPQVQQPVYVGTGTTSGGQQQTITAPATACQLSLGCMGSADWSKNSGGFSCTVTQTLIQCQK